MKSSITRRKFLINSGATVVGASALGSLVAACGGNATTNQHADTLVASITQVDFEQDFSPYSAANDGGTDLFIYEPLLYVNKMNGTFNPWLASSYQFSSDNKQITLKLRKDVKWNDGQPFTSADVLFTYNMKKQYPGTDTSGIWNYLTNVEAPDDFTIVLTLKDAFTPFLYYIGITQIVSKHIWSTVGDPTKYVDTKPVGTGPYMLKTFNPEQLTLQKNPIYWQAGKPKVQYLQFPVLKSNDIAQLNLFSGKLDWATNFVVGLDQNYVAKDPAHNHYWFPPDYTIHLYLNLTKKPFDQVAVRKAISAALDRPLMGKQAEDNYVTVASPTGMLLPPENSFLDPQYTGLAFKKDPQQAQTLLEQAGFKKGSDGIYADRDGNKLSFTIDVANDFSDWLQIDQIACQNLQDIGVDASVNPVSEADFSLRRYTGDYEATIGLVLGGPTPFFDYNSNLASSSTAPIGQKAYGGNYSRWKDPTTDKLLAQASTTNDLEVQKQAYYGLQKIFVDNMPTIPLLYGPGWFEYCSKRFTNWPSAQNPYVNPNSWLQMMINVEPV